MARSATSGGWFEWAERKHAEGFVQKRCPGCNRFAKWIKQDQRVPAPEVDVCPKCGTEGAQCCI